MVVGPLTSRFPVNLVLNKEIYHRDHTSKESKVGCETLAKNLSQADKRCSDVFPVVCQCGKLWLAQWTQTFAFS